MAETLPMPVTGPFTHAQKTSILNLVIRAADTEIMPRFKQLDAGEIDSKSHARDLVTIADTSAEAMITRGLQRAFPHAVIVGEEAAANMPDYRKALSEAELGFTIDPVDGTWNFVHGLPVFATMLSACRFGKPVFGLIYDPVGRDVIWAGLDQQAEMLARTGKKKSVQTAQRKPVEDMVGFIELNFLPDEHKSAAGAKCLELADFLNLRCSAHHYRMFAQGAVDFCLATKLNPWDHAPGVALTEHAGGYSAFLDGRHYSTAIDDGYLLSASSKETWLSLRDHFAALLTP